MCRGLFCACRYQHLKSWDNVSFAHHCVFCFGCRHTANYAEDVEMTSMSWNSSLRRHVFIFLLIFFYSYLKSVRLCHADYDLWQIYTFVNWFRFNISRVFGLNRFPKTIGHLENVSPFVFVFVSVFLLSSFVYCFLELVCLLSLKVIFWRCIFFLLAHVERISIPEIHIFIRSDI